MSVVLAKYQWRDVLRFIDDLATLCAAARTCRALRDAAASDVSWESAARLLPPWDHASPRDACLRAARFRSAVAVGESSSTASPGHRGTQFGAFELRLDADGAVGARFGVDGRGSARVVRRSVLRGRRPARWTKFAGTMVEGRTATRVVGLAERAPPNEGPAQQPALLPRPPLAVVFLATHEEGMGGEGMLGNNPSMVGVNAITPCEYRGLVLGPVLVGTFGFTPHACCRNRAIGTWYARLPDAPPVARSPEGPDFWPDFCGIALAAGDRGAAFLSASFGDFGTAVPARVSLRDNGDVAWRARELGHLAACQLSITSDSGAARARLHVGRQASDDGFYGPLNWAQLSFVGRWYQKGDAWCLSMDECGQNDSFGATFGPPPRSYATRSAFGEAARRLWPASSWPGALDRPRRSPASLEGTLAGGILVATVAFATSDHPSSALLALEVAGGVILE